LKPSHERRDEQLQRNHAPSLRQLPAMFSDTTRSFGLPLVFLFLHFHIS
jgi:hypothetical protein